MVRIDYDVIIAGGGVAGISAAAALREFGWSVLIVEPGQHSERRLAGELIHPRGVSALIELGLCNGNGLDGAVPIKGFIAIPGTDNVRSDIGLPYAEQPSNRGLALEHTRIRSQLRTAAEAIPYAKTIHGGRVVGVRDSGAWVTVTVKHAANIQELACRMVISADGASSPVRALAGISHSRWPVSVITGYVITDKNLPSPGYGHVFMGTLSPLLVYEIGGGRVRVLFDQSVKQSTIPPDLHRKQVTSAIPYPKLQAEITEAMEAQRGLSFVSSDLIVERTAHGRIVLVGDSGGSCHPLTATGMTIGMADALRLRDALRDSGGDISNGLAAYSMRRRAPQRARLLVASALHDACSGSSPESQIVRVGLIRYWTRGSRGRRTSMAILAMSDDRLTSAFREMLLVILHGVAPPWGRWSATGVARGLRLMAGLAGLVMRHMTFAMRAR
jgi:squalene monooxygenase